MNKTVSITLARLAFTVDEEGYPLLHDYLQAVAKHFASFDYGREVADDIEARLAERFSKKLADTKTQVISRADIESVIAEMGTVEQLSGDDSSAAPEKAPRAGRRLYRNPDDAVIGGVASGLAAYLGWDTALVRIIFFVAACLGWGIAVYIILWLVIPEAKTSAEKLEMRGSPLTVAGIEQAAREKAEYFKSNEFVKNVNGASKQIFTTFFSFLGTAFKTLGTLLRVIIGGIVTAGATLGALFLIFAAANLIVNKESPYFDQTITGVFSGLEYPLIVILAFLSIFIPLLFLALAGASVIRKRTSFSTSLTVALAAVWMAALISTGVMLIHKAPSIQAAAESYQGEAQTRPYAEMKNFNFVQASHGYLVSIRPGKEFSVTLNGNKRDLDETRVHLDGSKLILEHDYDNDILVCIFCNRRDVRVEITMPAINGIKVSGSSHITVADIPSKNFSAELSGASALNLISKAETLDLKASGSSDLQVQASAKKILLDMSGASSADMTGSSSEMKAELSGASSLKARELMVDKAEFKATGASDGTMNAKSTLSADLSGASTLEQYGPADVKIIEQSGSSDVIRK